jgi:hypothetical protein
LGDRTLVQAVLDDYTTAPISEKERALFAFLAKMIEDSRTIRREDADAVRAAGWSDEALYDAITVCSLFQFYNNWVDATGVSDMPAFAYEISGKRLATTGYVPSTPSVAPDVAFDPRTETAADSVAGPR